MIPFEEIDLQQDLSYREHPVAILEETKRKTRNKSIKFLKVKWHTIPTEKLRGNEKITFVLSTLPFSSPKSRDEIFL